jgi:hypothetical protein
MDHPAASAKWSREGPISILRLHPDGGELSYCFGSLIICSPSLGRSRRLGFVMAIGKFGAAEPRALKSGEEAGVSTGLRLANSGRWER